jgi:hypothetical protein
MFVACADGNRIDVLTQSGTGIVRHLVRAVAGSETGRWFQAVIRSSEQSGHPDSAIRGPLADVTG